MQEVLKTLQLLENTSIPNLLILAGFLFLLLAFVGRIGAIIELPQERQKWSGIIGGVLLILGLGLFLLPRIQSDSNPNEIDVYAGEPTTSPIVVTSNPQASLQELALYDDFNDPMFDGLYDQSLWQIGGDNVDMCKFVQQDGIIKIENFGEVESTCELFSEDYENLPLESTSTFELRFMLDSEGPAGIIQFLIEGKDLSGETWMSHCDINSVNSDIANVDCLYKTLYDVGNIRYITKQFQTEQRTWHKVRIEIDPDAMELTYYVDDQVLGSYHLDEANRIIDIYQFSIVLNRQESQGSLIGYADDVRIRVNE